MFQARMNDGETYWSYFRECLALAQGSKKVLFDFGCSEGFLMKNWLENIEGGFAFGLEVVIHRANSARVLLSSSFGSERWYVHTGSFGLSDEVVGGEEDVWLGLLEASNIVYCCSTRMQKKHVDMAGQLFLSFCVAGSCFFSFDRKVFAKNKTRVALLGSIPLKGEKGDPQRTSWLTDVTRTGGLDTHMFVFQKK